LRENGETIQLRTTAATVGEALRREGVTLYLADGVDPGLGEPISEGLVVTIDRATPVTVHSDGRVLRARTHHDTVEEVLSELGLVLAGQDYTSPTLESPVRPDLAINVVRVTDRFVFADEPIPFEVLWQADPGLEIDNHHLMQEGSPGVLQRRIRVHYEDGQEVARHVEDEYVAVPPKNKILGFGTKVVVRTLDTPEGPVEYWRTFRMLATSYSASTAGVSPSNRWYGRTRLGMPAGFGIIAVDPRWIPLRSNLYVPGYGTGYAGDTGGKIKGKRIDLCYDDDSLVLWYKWVDVYVLTPVPDTIDYSLNLFQ
jgi:3D (Asp-Asp-Asp) domain-containing protein